MPPATGFQYTPPSYLVRASDSTNRPWNKTEEGEGDHDNNGENEYDLPQEQRPQTRRETHLDAHFQQRVRNKQSRYRTILSGEADFAEESNVSESNTGDVEDDPVIAAAKNADSYADIHSTKLNLQAASTNQQARKIRKERITGVSEPRTSVESSEAENARSLRAHRLRNSLLKQTSDEYELQVKLEARRLARREEEEAARRAERAAMANMPNSKDLEQKRLTLEADQKAAARASEEAQVALQRAADLNEERIRQRDRDQLLEQYRQEEERMYRKDKGNKKGSKKNRYMKAKRYSDSDTWMTDFDAENDFAFLNDLSGIIRDSGLVKSCGSCFGGADDEEEGSFLMKSKACATISSVFVPDLTPSSDTSASEDGGMFDSATARRSREYALYRE